MRLAQRFAGGRFPYGVVLVVLAVVALVSFLAGEALTAPARRAVGAPPRDLPVVDVAFRSRSGVVIRGWLAPHPSLRGAVLLLHGIRADRRAMLARARFLYGAGYSVLLIDLQAHGESGGERITFGARESEDVEAAVAFLRDALPAQPLGAIGVSLGGAAIVLAKRAPPLSAVVLESVYPSIEEATANRLKQRFGPAGALLSPLLLGQIELRLALTTNDLRPIDAVARLDAHVLIIHGARDRHTTRLEAERLFAAARAPKTLWVVDGAAHVDLHRFAPREYEARVERFFAEALQRAR